MNAPPAMALAGVNALTIDVEEYFQTPAFVKRHPEINSDSIACRSEGNVDRLLVLLAEHDARATFFVLGWLAEKMPDAVRRIVASGHELASYGYQRSPVAEHGDGPFLADIRLAKAVLEDISGVEVKGFRAPGYAIGDMNAWAFDCMLAAGYRYNSNAFPPPQGDPLLAGPAGTPREVRPGLLDVPVAEFRALGFNFRAGGGDAFRAMPYWVSRRMLRSVQAKGEGATTFHIRSWEVDPGLVDRDPRRAPSVDLEVGPEVSPEVGYSIPMEPRIRRLLADFRWDRVDHIFLQELGGA